MTKKALIFGITGQDGAILSSILLKKIIKSMAFVEKINIQIYLN